MHEFIKINIQVSGDVPSVSDKVGPKGNRQKNHSILTFREELVGPHQVKSNCNYNQKSSDFRGKFG